MTNERLGDVDGEKNHLASDCFPLYVLKPIIRGSVSESRGGPKGPGGQCTALSLLFLSSRDSSLLLLLPPLIAIPFLAVVSSSFSRPSRVSSARWCYFRASVLCKCRTLALRCRFRCRARSIGQTIICNSARRGYRHLTLSNSPCARTRIFCREPFIYLFVYLCNYKK